MQVEYINPIVTATVSTLDTLIGLKVRRGQASAARTFRPPARTSFVAVIGMAGTVQGSVVLTFDDKVARDVVGRMVGGEAGSDEEVADGVGEVVNIIAGNTKTILNEQNLGLKLSIPNVVQGCEIRVHPPEGIPAILIPFESEIGTFSIQIAFTQPK